MLRFRKVAVTGGLSCGKSSVCQLLKELGAYVVSADSIVHQLLSSDKKLGQEVIDLLGPDIVVDEAIDRSRVAQIVFDDPELLTALEELIHPMVYRTIDQVYEQQAKSALFPVFIAEVPLLFESSGEKNFEYVIAVVANQEVCLERFKKMTGYPVEEFNRRVARQLPLLDKAIRADYVVINNGTLADIQPVIQELYQELVEK